MQHSGHVDSGAMQTCANLLLDTCANLIVIYLIIEINTACKTVLTNFCSQKSTSQAGAAAAARSKHAMTLLLAASIAAVASTSGSSSEMGNCWTFVIVFHIFGNMSEHVSRNLNTSRAIFGNSSFQEHSIHLNHLWNAWICTLRNSEKSATFAATFKRNLNGLTLYFQIFLWFRPKIDENSYNNYSREITQRKGNVEFRNDTRIIV